MTATTSNKPSAPHNPDHPDHANLITTARAPAPGAPGLSSPHIATRQRKSLTQNRIRAEPITQVVWPGLLALAPQPSGFAVGRLFHTASA